MTGTESRRAFDIARRRRHVATTPYGTDNGHRSRPKIVGDLSGPRGARPASTGDPSSGEPIAASIRRRQEPQRLAHGALDAIAHEGRIRWRTLISVDLESELPAVEALAGLHVDERDPVR